MNTINIIHPDGSIDTISADGELTLNDVLAPEAKVWIGQLRLFRGVLGPIEVGRATKLKHVPNVLFSSQQDSIERVARIQSQFTFPGSCLNESEDSEGETECAEPPEDPGPVEPPKLGKGYVMAPEPETLQDVYKNLGLHLHRKRKPAKRDFFKPDKHSKL